MQCIYCWTPVKARDRSGKTWGTGEETDERNWIHAQNRNPQGNPTCGRQFLLDSEVEEIESEASD